MAKRKSKTPVESQQEKKQKCLTLEMRVAKKLYDNCRHLPKECLDLIKDSEGLTMRQTLTRDLKDHESGTKKIAFGARYFTRLKHEYKPANDPWEALAPDEPLEEVSAALEGALDAADGRTKHRGPLLGYLEVAPTMNATEASGFIRFLLSLSPGNQKHHADAMLCLRFIRRVSLDKKLADKIRIAHDWIDSHMYESLRRWRARKHKLPDEDDMTWVANQKGLLCLIIAEASLDKVLGIAGSLSSCSEEPSLPSDLIARTLLELLRC